MKKPRNKNGYEVRKTVTGTDWWETITLLPKKGFPRQLCVRRNSRYKEMDYGGTLYPAKSKGYNMLAYVGAVPLEDVRIEKATYSDSWAIWFDRASFEVTPAEAHILELWLYPGPPLPAGWTTVKGVSKAPPPPPPAELPFFEVSNATQQATQRC